jgi:hypothetical protein
VEQLDVHNRVVGSPKIFGVVQAAAVVQIFAIGSPYGNDVGQFAAETHFLVVLSLY